MACVAVIQSWLLIPSTIRTRIGEGWEYPSRGDMARSAREHSVNCLREMAMRGTSKLTP